GGVETNPIHLSQAAKLSHQAGPPQTVAVPITTLADAKSRIEHHCRELEKALRNHYGANAIAPPHLHLPEPATIGFDESKGRSYYHAPILVFRGYGGWIDQPG
ncbi:hypothetical protein, partial [Nitrobacter sp.]|uniref:hypothetical protein n=1 Tax=Nitrobacter sp. TaxID=29420 RepID=UPI00321F9FB2